MVSCGHERKQLGAPDVPLLPFRQSTLHEATLSRTVHLCRSHITGEKARTHVRVHWRDCFRKQVNQTSEAEETPQADGDLLVRNVRVRLRPEDPNGVLIWVYRLAPVALLYRVVPCIAGLAPIISCVPRVSWEAREHLSQMTRPVFQRATELRVAQSSELQVHRQTKASSRRKRERAPVGRAPSPLLSVQHTLVRSARERLVI